MNWNLKKEMAELADSSEDNFQAFVLQHINDFDPQAWSIFVNCVALVPDEMKKNIDFWDAVNTVIHQSEETIQKTDMKTIIRITFIQSICEEELGLNRPKNNK
jgi:hypothetical protein